MPLGPCTVCDTNPTAQILSRLSDGETVNICDECIVPFALWLIEGQTGIPGTALTTMLEAGRQQLDEAAAEAAAGAGKGAKGGRKRSSGTKATQAPAEDDQAPTADTDATPPTGDATASPDA